MSFSVHRVSVRAAPPIEENQQVAKLQQVIAQQALNFDTLCATRLDSVVATVWATLDQNSTTDKIAHKICILLFKNHIETHTGNNDCIRSFEFQFDLFTPQELFYLIKVYRNLDVKEIRLLHRTFINLKAKNYTNHALHYADRLLAYTKDPGIIRDALNLTFLAPGNQQYELFQNIITLLSSLSLDNEPVRFLPKKYVLIEADRGEYVEGIYSPVNIARTILGTLEDVQDKYLNIAVKNLLLLTKDLTEQQDRLKLLDEICFLDVYWEDGLLFLLWYTERLMEGIENPSDKIALISVLKRMNKIGDVVEASSDFIEGIKDTKIIAKILSTVHSILTSEHTETTNPEKILSTARLFIKNISQPSDRLSLIQIFDSMADESFLEKSIIFKERLSELLESKKSPYTVFRLIYGTPEEIQSAILWTDLLAQSLNIHDRDHKVELQIGALSQMCYLYNVETVAELASIYFQEHIVTAPVEVLRTIRTFLDLSLSRDDLADAIRVATLKDLTDLNAHTYFQGIRRMLEISAEIDTITF